MREILGFWWVRPERAEGCDGYESSETTTRTRQINARVLPLRKGYPEDMVGHQPSTRREGVASLNLKGLVNNA